MTREDLWKRLAETDRIVAVNKRAGREAHGWPWLHPTVQEVRDREAKR